MNYVAYFLIFQIESMGEQLTDQNLNKVNECISDCKDYFHSLLVGEGYYSINVSWVQL